MDVNGVEGNAPLMKIFATKRVAKLPNLWYYNYVRTSVQHPTLVRAGNCADFPKLQRRLRNMFMFLKAEGGSSGSGGANQAKATRSGAANRATASRTGVANQAKATRGTGRSGK